MDWEEFFYDNAGIDRFINDGLQPINGNGSQAEKSHKEANANPSDEIEEKPMLPLITTI